MQQSDNKHQQFTPQDVKIISRKSLYRGFFSMVKYTFQHKLFAGGWSNPVEREMFERALMPLRCCPMTLSKTKLF